MSTLISFHLSTRPEAAFVQLLGSWDNFSKPYTLARDPKVGKSVWRACPYFTGVICDGERIESTPREGGLRMGSVYWYFYLVNNEDEIVDSSSPTTRACPFLPGQEVNVLEVPMMIHQRRASSSSTTSSVDFTLNPDDKFEPIPPGQLSPTFDRMQWRAPPPSPQGVTHAEPPRADEQGVVEGDLPPTPLPIYTTAVATGTYEASPPSSPLSSHASSCATYEQRPESQPTMRNILPWHHWLPARNLWSAGDASWLEARGRRGLLDRLDADMSRPVSTAPQTPQHQHDTTDLLQVLEQEQSSSPRTTVGSEELAKNESAARFNEHAANVPAHVSLALSSAAPYNEPAADSPSDLSLALKLDLGASLDISLDHDHDDFMSNFEQSLSRFGEMDLDPSMSPETNEDMISAESAAGSCGMGLQKTFSTRSSTFFSTDAASALFSRPMTPWQTEISVDFSPSEQVLPEKDAEPHDVYSLQQNERASALTLHTLRALPDDLRATPTNGSKNFNGFAAPASRLRVEEWVDHSKNTTLDQLREDMSYLCSLIE